MSTNFPNQNCTKTSSNCIVWDGPDIPCLTICKGTPITALIFQLAMKYCDIIAPLSTTYRVECLQGVSSTSSIPEVLQAVIDKLCSLVLQTGDQGPQGLPGAAGPKGDYVETTPILAGQVCACGGVKVIVKNGINNAMISERIVCNGCPGTPGTPGAAGVQGLTGQPGPQGNPGPTGPTGPQGPQGVVGPTGPTGPIGLTGDKGDTGLQGPIGPTGATGATGNNGKSGRGIAAFIGGVQPDGTRFTTEYGTAEGFGVNFLPGNNQIKPGDIWLVCNP